ncbi:MAG: ROK family protein [Culicoidibacterales bacterium]
MEHYIGIDIGGTDIKYGLIDCQGNIIESNKVPTPKTKIGLLNALKPICNMYPDIEGVGISAPGIISDEGLMITAGALFDCYGMNMIEEISKFYTGPIAVENDVNCAALAELWTGSGKTHENFLVVAVGTGIGGAIVIDNKLYRGSRYMAGEFGFQKMCAKAKEDPDNTMLSRTGSVFGGLIRMYQEQSGETLDGETIFERAESGEVLANQIIEAFYDHLSTGIFNLIVSFDPEVVLVGGAISKREGFIEKINDNIEIIRAEYEDQLEVELAKVKACTHFNDAGIIGGVANLLKKTKA